MGERLRQIDGIGSFVQLNVSAPWICNERERAAIITACVVRRNCCERGTESRMTTLICRKSMTPSVIFSTSPVPARVIIFWLQASRPSPNSWTTS